MTMSRSWYGAAATLCLLILPSIGSEPPKAQSQPGPYAVTDLGTFGTIQSAAAYDINDAGQIAGFAASRAFVWQNGQLTQLPSGGGSTAAAINNVQPDRRVCSPRCRPRTRTRCCGTTAR